MLLDTSLLNTQQYKVRIKGKVGQSRERSSSVVAIKKGAFWSPSTTVANFIFPNVQNVSEKFVSFDMYWVFQKSYHFVI